MLAVTDSIDARLQQYLEEHQLASRTTKVVPLTCDASDRRYFRILLQRAPSVVLAVHAGPIDFASMPFVSIARLMTRMGLPVPDILHHSDPLGIIGLQDLGDVTLQAHLGAATADQHAALYREAVSLIARLQQRGAELASDEYPPYRIAFDTDKLSWEMEFFFKYFVKAYRGASPDVDVQRALSEEWSAMIQQLAAEPRVLCHRDYHSRNLMLHSGSLFIIDFQDARMGPDTYDLVSLLRDSYVDMPEGDFDELVGHFVALKREGCPSMATPEWEASFLTRFEMMALQRNLKALGTFGYQTTARSNPVYIQYIPRTLRYVATALERQPRFARLHGLLAGLIEELA
jgi:N-acetylmuramate 1-kinase